MDENQKKAKQLIDELQKRYEKEPETMSSSERRLMAKYQKEKNQSLQSLQDIQQIEQQIEQARARVRRLQLEASASQGRASAFLELLMPEDLQDAIAGPIGEPLIDKGNGQDAPEAKTSSPNPDGNGSTSPKKAQKAKNKGGPKKKPSTKQTKAQA